MRRGMSSLRAITGYSQSDIAGMKVSHPMGYAGEDQVDPSRRVVIQKDRLALTHDTEQSFEIVVKFIARLIAQHRPEVVKALISTGSPSSVANVRRRRLNAVVQNRLAQKDEMGARFREMVTMMLAEYYGRQLENDQFFRKAETFVGSNGEDDNDELNADTDNDVSDKGQADIGGILQGSAQVITAIGGVIGLFTGGQQTNEGGSSFDQYNEDDYNDDDKGNGGGNKWIIWLVVGAVVVVGGYFLIKKFRK